MNPCDIIDNELDDDLKAAGDITFPLLLQIQQLRATRQLSKDIQYLIKEVGSFRIEQAKVEYEIRLDNDVTSLKDIITDLPGKAKRKIQATETPYGSIKRPKGKLPRLPNVDDVRKAMCTCRPGYHSDKCPVHGRRTG